MKKVLFILLILTSSFSNTIAQESYIPGNYTINNYSPKQYNAYIQNWGVVQDARGVTYFANGFGVLEFDGKNWKLFKLQNESMVFSIGMDEYNTVYAGGIDDFGYLSINEKGQKKYVSLVPKVPEEHRDFSTIYRIHYTKTYGVIFTSKTKIFLYKNNEITVIPFNSRSLSYTVYKQYFLNDSVGMNVLVDGKLKLLPNTGTLRLQDNSNVHVLNYTNGELLFASRLKGLFTYNYAKLLDNGKLPSNIENIKVDKNILQKFETECDDYFKRYQIYTISTINDSLYAFGTLGGGIVLINDKGKLVKIINKKNGLIDDNVYYLFSDKNENLWVATNNGISYVLINSPFTNFDGKNNVIATATSTIRYNNRFYLGTFASYLYLPEYQYSIDETLSNFQEVSRTFVLSNIVFNDKLFFGTTNGVFQVNNEKAKYIIKTRDVVYSMGYSKKFKDLLFLGSRNEFLAIKLNFKSKGQWLKEIERFSFDELNIIVRKVNEDKKGNLWISSEVNGIYYIEFLSDDVSDYKVHKFDESNGLPSNMGNEAYAYKNKVLAITENGVYEAIIDDKDGFSAEFVPSEEFKILPEELKALRYFKTKNDKIWIGTVNKLGVLEELDGKYELNTTPFKPITGSIEYIYCDKDDVVWYSINDELLRYDSKKKKNYKAQYNAYIRKITLALDSTIYNGNYFKDTIINKDTLKILDFEQAKSFIPEFEYVNNHIVFEYASGFYEYSDKIKYSYILEGFDAEYSSWTNETKKEYTNLPEGKYTFKVKAINAFEHESTIAKYSFTILAPWYRTWWAITSYLILLIVFIYFIVKLNLRRLKAANIRLENTVLERTQEIQEQKEEIVAQNEELIQSREEISAQRDSIEEKNKELMKLSIAMNNTDNAILIMDRQGNFEWANAEFDNLFGYSFEEHIKKFGRSMIEASSNPEIKNIFDECVKEKKSVIYESKAVHTSGKESWLQTTLTPIIDQTDEVTGLVAIDSDITKIKEAESEIKSQRDELYLKNEKIKSSIQYAQTIQNAILPDKEMIDNYFESFIIFRPKDIVSGDFYWYTKVDNYHYLAVVDCTGHGVPGAFMSMIGSRLLNEIIVEQKISSTKEILDQLNERISKVLRQEQTSVPDGMDLCFCKFELGEKPKVMFTGAKINLIWYKGNEKKLEVIKGDRKSIGGPAKRISREFTYTELELSQGDILYMASDGYIDQNNLDRMKFGSREFHETIKMVADKPLEEQKRIMELIIDEWMKGTPQRDDITVMGLRIK